MGTMSKMRESTGVILWILVIAFGVIWVLQDAGTFENVNRSGRDAITVGESAVTIQEYQEAVNNRVQRIERKTGERISPQRRDMIREQVYNFMVENELRKQEMDRLGITVSDQEVYDLITGDNPPRIIQQAFSDGEGGVDRALLQNAMDNPKMRPQWIQIEKQVRSQRRNQKLMSLMNAAAHVSQQDVKETYRRKNKKVSAQYVALPYAQVSSDSVQVSEQDLRDYYETNKEDYKRKRSYQVSYVTLSKEATRQDTMEARKNLREMRDQFANAENDSLFLARNASAQPYSGNWRGRNDLLDAVAEAVFQNPEPGRIVGPLAAGNQVHLVKIMDAREAESPSVKARHILLRTSDGNAAQKRRRAQELKQQLQQGEATFAELARRYSDDGTASQGGDLGWFSEGRMVPAFEKTAFNADIGKVIGPVKTRFGYHLIKVEERASQEVKIADLARGVRPNPSTLQNLRSKLEDLSYFTNESGNFKKEAKRLNLKVQQMQAEKGQKKLPGIGRSSDLTNFLSGSEAGATSEVIDLGDKYLVAHVNEITEAGYRPFSKVKSEVRPRVLLKKKRKVQTSRLRRALQQTNFAGLPQAVGASIQTATGVTMAEPTIQGLGRAPKFVGTAMALKQGQTSGVLEGENAAYVLKVTGVEEPPPLTDMKRKQLQQQLKRQRQRELRQEWIAGLKEQTEIRDNRAQFQQ
jgi:peptidylprolyl isomerase/peptidyl-prolyl cis-trans isomerase D